MDQRAIEFCSVIPTNESLTEFGSIDRREGIHPSIFLSKTHRGKSERPFCPELVAKTRAFQWGLNRLSGWRLPGKEQVEDYLRDMGRRGLRPKTYSSNLTAIYIFLTIIRGSGKIRLEEITKNDLEVFIEHQQDRGLMISTGRLAYDPKILLKGVLLGYSRGLISSRQIERACRENVTFMALTCREQPDHSTIAGFVSSMKEEVKSIFRDVLLVCGEDYFEGKTFTADSNYHSPPNLRKCEEEGLDAYIPDKRFRRRDPRFEREHKQGQRRTDRLTLADFEHHEQRALARRFGQKATELFS